jgi:hypothetical protein
MNEMIGRRISWPWRGLFRHGVVTSVLGHGEDAVYLVNADDGGQAVVPCTLVASVA